MIEGLRKQNIQHFFIENITNVIDFQRLTHNIRKEYAHGCSFILTGDSPYAFYIAGKTSLLYSIAYFPTYTIYELNSTYDNYLNSAVFQNIHRGLDIREHDDWRLDFKYVLSLYEKNLLDCEIMKVLKGEDVENKKAIQDLLVKSSVLIDLKNENYEFRYSEMKKILNM